MKQRQNIVQVKIYSDFNANIYICKRKNMFKIDYSCPIPVELRHSHDQKSDFHAILKLGSLWMTLTQFLLTWPVCINYLFDDFLITGRYKTKFIEAIEKLTPGARFDLIKFNGVSVNTELGNIKVEQIIPLFNILASQKNFSASGFVTSAQLHKEEKEKSVWSSED